MFLTLKSRPAALGVAASSMLAVMMSTLIHAPAVEAGTAVSETAVESESRGLLSRLTPEKIDPSGRTTDPGSDPADIGWLEGPETIMTQEEIAAVKDIMVANPGGHWVADLDMGAEEILDYENQDPESQPDVVFPVGDPQGTTDELAQIARSAPHPGGPGIPFSGWAACGVNDSRYKVVRDYDRYRYAGMEGSYARLYCGRVDSVQGGESAFGFRHIRDKRQSALSAYAGMMNRQWRDFTGWAMDWITYDPDQIWKPRAVRHCYQRKFVYIVGDTTLIKKRFMLITGETGVRIMTFFPGDFTGKGYCNIHGSKRGSQAMVMFRRS